MKKIALLFALLMAAAPGFAQDLNAKADNILGDYLVPDKKNGDSKVHFTKNPDGTYDCRVYWLQIPVDPATGKPWLDFRNPDKSKRSQRVDQLYLIRGLKYNASKKQWDGVKIYDPNRGINANVTCKLTPSGDLQVKGTILGIGESYVWPRCK